MIAPDGRRARLISAAAILSLALFAAWRIGVFSPWTTVAGVNGPVVIPNALAGVDHPFHIARAEVLRRSWASGEPLRWVGSHQQGYPSEFYPFGAQAIAVAFWAVTLGALPIGWAHGAMVALVFALPGLAFWLAARRDGLPASVALLAYAGQVAVPGAWWHGGYTELVQWGLVTNVAGAVWQLLALVWLAGWVRKGARLDGALAIAAGGVALLTNPRSTFALAAVFGGVALASFIPPRWQTPPKAVLARLALAGCGMALVAAPELLSLARFSRYYTFLHYSGYASVAEWLASSAVAAWLPFAAMCLVGIGLSLAGGRADGLASSEIGGDAVPTSRAAACTLLLYGALTATAIARPGLVSQLEATRLMPFQRLLMLWLGAFGAWAAVAALLRHGRRDAGGPVMMVLSAGVIAFWLRPGSDPMPLPGPPVAPERGLYRVARTGEPSQAALESAVRAADAAAAPGTAILVVGSNLSWHQQLWAPLWSERPFLYDNWLWFWRADHDGPPGYTFEGGHSYPKPQLALDKEYLSAHGIGAVVATDAFAGAAAKRPFLESISGEGSSYGAWLVRDPLPLMVSGGEVAAHDVAFGNGRVTGIASSGGETILSQAWFPRWRATIDGDPAAAAKTPSGTIAIEAVPSGASLEVQYETDALDWLGRLLACAGIALIAAIAIAPRRRPRRAIRGGGVSS